MKEDFIISIVLFVTDFILLGALYFILKKIRTEIKNAEFVNEVANDTLRSVSESLTEYQTVINAGKLVVQDMIKTTDTFDNLIHLHSATNSIEDVLKDEVVAKKPRKPRTTK